MIKIRKGNLTAFVPRSTFKNHYEKLGWMAKSSKNRRNPIEYELPIDEEIVEDVQQESDENADLLSYRENMSLEQLRKFAAQNNIDISAANSKREIRTIIEAAL